MTASTERYDVVVVGARAAGAATAMLLAQQGRKVLAIDRAAYGTDTLSTHAIMRGGVLQLHRWGLLDRVVAAGTPPIRTTVFDYDGDEVTVEIKAADGIDALYAPRRTVLDPILVDAAREAGADVRFGMSMTGLRRAGDGRVTGIRANCRGAQLDVEAELVVGADGVRSRVARDAGAPIERSARAVGGAIYAYFEDLPSRGNEWHYHPGIAAGLIPTNDGRTCLFVGTDSRRYRVEARQGLPAAFQRLLSHGSASLAGRVGGARRVSRFHGFPGVRGYLRGASGPGWALVGDAGYFKDPITAHGITDALRDAELLARAVAADRLVDYQRERDRVSLGVFEVTDTIAGYRWSLDDLRSHLLELSKAMNDEVALLRSLQPAPVAA